MRRLLDASLEHRLVVIVLALLLAGAGWVAFRQLPIDAFPDVTNIQVTVISQAPTLSPLEIEQPAEGEEIPQERAGSRAIVVRDGGFLSRRPSGRLALVLDRDHVRDVGSGEDATLGALLPEDRDLEPGEHVLAVVACDAEGRALRDARGKARASVRRFWVGPRRPAVTGAGAAWLVVLHPRGTFNGALAAERATLDLVVFGADLSPGKVWVEVAVTGPGTRSQVALTREGLYWMSGLTSGDHRVDVSLQGAPAGGWTLATRRITVNLDAPGVRAEAPR